MNDLISRQDVLKILSSKNAAWDAYDKVKRLPSAQPETHEERTETHACDCISRQAAIDALDGFRCGTKAAWKVIEDLPSAQPVNYGSTKSDSFSQLKLNNDLISRQAALELIHNLYPSEPIMRRNRERWKERYRQYIEVEEALERLPPAQPERKKGKWIDNDKINFPQCSECGMWIDVMQQSGEMNYCPHCGADMRQMEDDNV